MVYANESEIRIRFAKLCFGSYKKWCYNLGYSPSDVENLHRYMAVRYAIKEGAK